MTVPYQYQEEGVAGIQKFGGRCLLADDMGLGKTFQALLWMQRHLKGGPILVVCPASIKYNWEREAAKHVGMRCEILGGRIPPKGWRPGPKSTIYVVNWDVLGDTKSAERSWWRVLSGIGLRCVVGDEIQAIANWKAKRSRAFRVICEDVPHVILTSGTPFNAYPDQLWPSLRILCPEVEEFKNRLTFIHKFCKLEKSFGDWKVTGAKNATVLHDMLRNTCMIRRRTEDVLDQLPPLVRNVVVTDIDNRKEYEKDKKEVTAYLNELKGQGGLAVAAQRRNAVGHLKRLAAQGKLQSVIDWIRDFLDGTDEKLMVFGIHRSILHTIHETFPRSVLVTGAVTGEDRQLAFDRFNEKSKCRLFVGNIHAAGVGWSCRSARTTLFAELDWRPNAHSQAEKRVHGVGRGIANRKSRAFYLVAKDTIEERVCELLETKQDWADAVLDGGVQEGSINVQEMLVKELQKGKL